MTDTDLVAWTARTIADDYCATAGLQDVRIGVTREGYAQSKRHIAERIVLRCLQEIAADMFVKLMKQGDRPA